jgi:transcriptional regulator with PAS, ATPase and Fis domain
LPAQAKLLRVLQNREVQRVGSLTSRSVDVRVVAATHRDLKNMVREGRFREDLFYRLAVVEITLPPLASRREDLPLLERYFVEKFAAEYNKTISGMTRRCQTRMAGYHWPGNVRELENAIGTACMMAEGNLIDIHDLPENLRERAEIIRTGNGEEDLLSLEELQRRHVLRVLDAVDGHKAKAAEILGIGRATIYQLLSKMKDDGKSESTQ